ncbi:MAG TPA: response regulator transcription factor [Ktedonosporobacter sp.]|nr:response regulator transcription factor [Ktedonosporobacter sp.]
MTRVFVIAPTPIVQAGLQAILTSSQIQVVGMAADANALDEQAVDGIVDADVIVVADEQQVEAIGRTLPPQRSVALIVLTNHSERVLPQLRTLDVRGWGIVPLDASNMQLQAAVLAAQWGLAVIPSSQAQRLQENQHAARSLMLETSEEALTPREREVLELVSQGLSNKLIARQLLISEHTVKFHISSIATKLGASSRTEAVNLGLRRGLITL